MKYEDAFINPTINGLKIFDNLHTKAIFPESIRMAYNQKIAFYDLSGGDGRHNNNYFNITIDGFPRMNYVMGDNNGEHRFYCGSPSTANDGDLVMTISDTSINVNRPILFNNQPYSSGGYTEEEVDTLLSNKLTTDAPKSTGKLNVNTEGAQLTLSDATADKTITFSTGDTIECSEATTSSNEAELKLNFNKQANVRIGDTTGSLSINEAKRTDTTFSVNGKSHFADNVAIVDTKEWQTNIINSNGDIDLYLKRDNVDFMIFNWQYNRIEIPRNIWYQANLTFDTFGALALFRRWETTLEILTYQNNYSTGTNRFTITNGTTAQRRILEMTNTNITAYRVLKCNGKVETDEINSVTDVDLVFKRFNTEYMTFSTTDQKHLNKSVIYWNNSINCNEIRNAATDEDINFVHEATTYLTYDYTNDNLISKSAYFTVENSLGCNSFVNRVALQDVQFGYEGTPYLEYKHATDEVK